jgi:hypothetical protein
MGQLNWAWLMAQAQTTDATVPTMIDQQGEDLIYLGVALILFVLIVAFGVINRRIETALIFATLLSLTLILVVTFL